VLLVAAKGKIKRGTQRDLELCGKDLVVKPARGKGGGGIQLWRRLDSGGFRAAGGDPIDAEALAERVRLRSKKGRLLVQPRLGNHPDLAALAGDALSTVRIVTALNERGEVEATDAVFKMAADGAFVDNFHHGGLAASVDLVSGSLGRATGLDPNSGHHDRHPTRGATIEGTKLPMWEATLDLALCAHRLFPAQVLLAWDIAMTPKGPVLLEANGRPGFHMTQRASGIPMGESRLGQILAEHIRRLDGET
jgi:glutathione synthase/RimK-type ligase-like ATP-grasp enzyme